MAATANPDAITRPEFESTMQGMVSRLTALEAGATANPCPGQRGRSCEIGPVRGRHPERVPVGQVAGDVCPGGRTRRLGLPLPAVLPAIRRGPHRDEGSARHGTPGASRADRWLTQGHAGRARRHAGRTRHHPPSDRFRAGNALSGSRPFSPGRNRAPKVDPRERAHWLLGSAASGPIEFGGRIRRCRNSDVVVMPYRDSYV